MSSRKFWTSRSRELVYPAGTPLDRRFLRRLKQIEKLSPHQQKILLGTIDAFIAKVS